MHRSPRGWRPLIVRVHLVGINPSTRRINGRPPEAFADSQAPVRSATEDIHLTFAIHGNALNRPEESRIARITIPVISCASTGHKANHVRGNTAGGRIELIFHHTNTLLIAIAKINSRAVIHAINHLDAVHISEFHFERSKGPSWR